MQEQIIQLLENKDEANVLIGLEMIKGWGYSHDLLNHLIAVYLFSSNPYLRQSILTIMEQYAPKEIAQLYMENWMVFNGRFDQYISLTGYNHHLNRHLLNILKDVVQLECIDQVKFINLVLNHSSLDIFEVSEKLGISLHHIEKTAQIESINQTQEQSPAFLNALDKFTSLTKLNLASAKLAQVPQGIGSLQKLRYAFLQDNDLQTLTKELFECDHLKYLDLSNNQLREIPPQIQQLKNLKTLILSHNQLKSLPQEIGLLPHLEILTLDNNQLKTLPATISKAAKLKELDLSNNQLIQLPHDISQLHSLTKLDLENNQLVKLPVSPHGWQSLEILLLRNNDLKSWAVPHLAMPNLEWLDVTFNQIPYIQPFDWAHLHKLTNLWCEHNFISSRELATLKQVLPKAYLVPNPPPQKPLIVNPQRLL